MICQSMSDILIFYNSEPGYIAMARHYATHQLSGLTPANEVQLEAVEHAMTRPFSLIQGPPGTGKTVTAVRLASLFARLNMTLPSSDTGIRPQVMICGPSNKAVDVVAGMLIVLEAFELN